MVKQNNQSDYYKHLFSDCCNAPINVGGPEVGHRFTCTKCKYACNAHFVKEAEVQQPAEGELVPIPSKYNAQFDYDRRSAYDEGRQDQLAHMKATMVDREEYEIMRTAHGRLNQDLLDLQEQMAMMVKLPSEEKLVLWLCDHLSYTSRGLAQELIERLEGEKS